MEQFHQKLVRKSALLDDRIEGFGDIWDSTVLRSIAPSRLARSTGFSISVVGEPGAGRMCEIR
jgi:hypothetical protein